MRKIWLFLAFICTLFAEPNFPTLSGRVVDNAGILTPAQIQNLTAKLSHHEQNSSNQIVVVTLKSLQNYDIADFGYQLGRHWQIGQKGKDNGVLLIVAPNEKKVRIEVGYGLEGALTDATAKNIIENKIIPYFKNRDYFAGINSGLDSIFSAIKGEYTSESLGFSSEKPSDFIVPILFLLFFLFNFIPRSFHSKPQKNRIFTGLIAGGALGVFSFVMFSVLIVSMLVGVIVFLLVIFGKVPKSTLHDNSGFGGNRGGFGGGFSGGGGSFGGGGASGGW